MHSRVEYGVDAQRLTFDRIGTNVLPLQSPSTRPIMVTAIGARPLIKAATPANFDGECEKGKAFMATCRTYIHLNPSAFADDDTKIIWAMSYMKSGRAS